MTERIKDPVYALFPFVDRASYKISVWADDSAMAAVAVVLVLLFVRDGDHTSALDRQRLRVLELDRGLAEARLRVVQAQIEPHFLFNTLANVRRLYDVDRDGGRAMLRHFKGVLEGALPAMRERESTLAQEVAHASAYLNVQQIRMGRRLAYVVDVPDELQGASFPPMMLLTLVENAVKHGLAPLPQGGTIRVAARRENGALCVRVIDTGCGFGTGTSGTGIGLANVEARLRAAFGDRGRLLLEENPHGGVTAAIEVPV
jgi:sensor histidine kinase YesM